MRPRDLSAVLSRTIAARLPVLVVGAPGIGKSDIVAQSAASAGCELLIEHPVVSDPTDYKGLPFAQNGTADFLPFGGLRKLIEATAPLVCFLDDLGQAPPAVQAACMQLLLARRINGHAVSDQVSFIAASNRTTDRAGVSTMLEPVKSRFCSIITLEADVDDWSVWALAAQLPTELIAFFRFRPALLCDFHPTTALTNSPSPRTAHNVARLMAAGIPPGAEYEVFSGAAGEAFAAEFCAFLRVFRDLPNPDAVLMNPASAAVPTDPATLYALSGALSAKATDANFGRLATYCERLPREFSVLTVTTAVKRNGKLTATRGFIEWSTTHADVLM